MGNIELWSQGKEYERDVGEVIVEGPLTVVGKPITITLPVGIILHTFRATLPDGGRMVIKRLDEATAAELALGEEGG